MTAASPLTGRPGREGRAARRGAPTPHPGCNHTANHGGGAHTFAAATGARAARRARLVASADCAPPRGRRSIRRPTPAGLPPLFFWPGHLGAYVRRRKHPMNEKGTPQREVSTEQQRRLDRVDGNGTGTSACNRDAESACTVLLRLYGTSRSRMCRPTTRRRYEHTAGAQHSSCVFSGVISVGHGRLT